MPQSNEGVMAACSSSIAETQLDGVLLDFGIVDSLPLAACICDNSGRVLAWNRPASRLWGREPDRCSADEKYYGAYRFYRSDGTELAPADTPLARLLASGVPVTGADLIIERPNGSRIRCSINAAPLRSADRNVAGAILCFQPVASQMNVMLLDESSNRHYQELLEALPVAIYTTDAVGKITFYNEAAVALSGRRPRLGTDEWCISWRLFTVDGTPMPHDQCPMARALAEDRPIRGEEAIAERPNGSRVHFQPYPTPLHDDAGTLIGAVNMLVDITERKRDELELQRLSTALEERVVERTRELADTIAELRESERRFRLLVRGVSDYAIFMLDVEGRVTNWNPGAQRIKGYTEAEIVGQHFSIFYTEDDQDAGVPQRALAIARSVGRFESEGWRRRKDGHRFWASAVIDAICDDDGKLIGFAKITRDLTEKRAIEDQLRQAQKMEAIGQLTGGIAHDFNNHLAVVVGNLESLKRRFEGVTPDRELAFRRLIDGALRGTDRAAALTRQLLAFSRQQTLDPQPIEPGALIEGIFELLRRSLGERITVEAAVPPDIWTILADANQLESALLNLAVNARDAMSDGGRLIISAGNRHLSAVDAAGYPELRPGEYVVISVKDTGTGMPGSVIAKAFEPFFTTKAPSQGSGLGLSQVYGFAKQSGGHATIESEVGIGTTICLHLPRFRGILPQALPNRVGQGAEPAQRNELILLVEDDDLVRPCSIDMLQDLGYRVVAARDGREALRLLDANPGINLIFTDLGLPGALNGERMAELARRHRPEIKILFTTGYVQADKMTRSRLLAGTEMLGKPFTFASLGEKIRQLLDDERNQSG
jgi:PAS domain S-box-containing protein